MAVMTQVPPMVLEFLMDKALEAMESGNPVTFSIHAQGEACGDHCPVHFMA